MASEKFKCPKCLKLKVEKEYYKRRSGERIDICKSCLTRHVDAFDPKTFLYILEQIDIPYVEGVWTTIRDKEFTKDPRKFNNASVFGKYAAQMRLGQWKNYGYADTEKIAEELRGSEEEKAEAAKEEEEKYEASLWEMYSKGDIAIEQYRTLAPVELQHRRFLQESVDIDVVGENNAYRQVGDNAGIEVDRNEELIKSQLTEDDKTYLISKWGRYYKPSEWLDLERKYRAMKKSFDIEDSDTDSSLVFTCKTWLKMNQAIDGGDYDSYNRLAKTYSDIRKTAKFTKAQKKESGDGILDCLGVMVAYCEKYGGRIPKYDISTDLDIVDIVIRDNKTYVKNLINEDYSLANQISNYLAKREKLDEEKRLKEEAAANNNEEGQDYLIAKDKDHEALMEKIKEYRNDGKIRYGVVGQPINDEYSLNSEEIGDEE